jgi:hypothetical protein
MKKSYRTAFYDKLATIVEHEVIEDGDSRIYKFNYYSGFVKRHFDKILNQYLKLNLSKTEFFELLSDSGFSASRIQRQFRGLAPMLAIEFHEYTKSLNADSKGNLKLDVFTHERDGNRLIIQRNINPKFYINISVHDPNDYDIDFINLKDFQFTEQRTLRYFKSALLSYFKGDKAKFITKHKYLIRFRLRFYKGEFNKRIKMQ